MHISQNKGETGLQPTRPHLCSCQTIEGGVRANRNKSGVYIDKIYVVTKYNGRFE